MGILEIIENLEELTDKTHSRFNEEVFDFVQKRAYYVFNFSRMMGINPPANCNWEKAKNKIAENTLSYLQRATSMAIGETCTIRIEEYYVIPDRLLDLVIPSHLSQSAGMQNSKKAL